MILGRAAKNVAALCAAVLVTCVHPWRCSNGHSHNGMAYSAYGAQMHAIGSYVNNGKEKIKTDTKALDSIKTSFKFYDEIPLDMDTQKFVWYACNEYGIDCSVVYGIIYHESRFVPDVISSTDDYGLMQINRINHEWLSDEVGRELDFLDPIDNIEAGIVLLSKIYKENLVDTMMAYSLGETGAANARSAGICQTECVGEMIRDITHYELLMDNGSEGHAMQWEVHV